MLRIYDHEEHELPILLVEIEGALDMASSERFFDAMEARGETDRPRIWMIMDATQARMPGMPVLKRWAEWIDGSKELTRRNCYGLVQVIPSAAVRGSLKFVNRLAPPAVETAVVRTLEDAHAYVAERVAESGLVSKAEYMARLPKKAG